jgi:malonyl-CoA O-methyltransferase
MPSAIGAAIERSSGRGGYATVMKPHDRPKLETQSQSQPQPQSESQPQAGPVSAGEGIDPRAVRRRFDRAAQLQRASLAASKVARPDVPATLLDDEVAQRMAQRLDWVRIQPTRILDAGCGAGDARMLLRQRYPEADWLGLDSSSAMLGLARAKFDRKYHGDGRPWAVLQAACTTGLQRLRDWLQRRPGTRSGLICADIGALPLPSASVGLVWSNLALPWVADLPAGLHELHRVLEPGGLLTFSSYGPDTIKELRLALNDPGQHVDRAAQHVHPFVDMHDLGDQLVQTGFAAPVMDMEIIRLSWPDAAACLRELHYSGQGNALWQRPRGLRAPRTWRALCERLQQQAGDGNGRVSLSFEIVYGHAWRGRPRQADLAKAQSKVIQFQARPGVTSALP